MIEWILSSSVLIVLVILVRAIFNGRIKAGLQYALWGLVLLRLLVPGALFSSPMSVTNVLPDASALTAPILKRPANPLENISEIPSQKAPEFNLDGIQSGYPDVESTKQQSVIRWENVVKGIWIAGSCVIGVVFFVSNLTFRYKLRKNRTPLNVPNCRLRIYESDAVETPCLFGMLHPSIYVTKDVLAEPMVMRHALAHEMTHYRHGDHLWAILRVICLAIHWFNPLVWCAVVLSRRDAELACDESTIRRLGEGERAAYGKTLLRLTCQQPTNFLRTATTMTGSQKEIRERIVRIVKRSKMTVIALILVLVLTGVAAGCTFTGRETVPPSEEINGQEVTSIQESTGVQEESTEPETIATEPMSLTAPQDFEVRRAAEKIELYPFTDEELAAAVKLVQKYLDEAAEETGVLTYDVECIAYDPIMTDVHIRQKIAGAPVTGWEEEDYYAHQISFAVTYSATYDHEKSPVQDVNHGVISVDLNRENVQTPWAFQDSGVPVEEYSDRAMSLEELAGVTDAGGRILAGYEVGDDACWFYLCDDATGKIRFIQENS